MKEFDELYRGRTYLCRARVRLAIADLSSFSKIDRVAKGFRSSVILPDDARRHFASVISECASPIMSLQSGEAELSVLTNEEFMFEAGQKFTLGAPGIVAAQGEFIEILEFTPTPDQGP